MGYLVSCVKKIDSVTFHPIAAGKCINDLAKAVRFAPGGLYILTKKGEIYTDGEMGGKFCLCGTGSDHHAVKALVAFGIINDDDAMRHGEIKRKADENGKRYRAVSFELERLTDAGIKLTKKQLRQITALREALEPKSLPYYIREKEVAATLAAFDAKYGTGKKGN